MYLSLYSIVTSTTALYNFYAVSVVSEASLHKALYLPAYMVRSFCRLALVLREVFIQIRQHFQTAMNKGY